MDNTESHIKGDTSWTPEGFVEVIGPNGNITLSQSFMHWHYKTTLIDQKIKKKMEIEKGAGTVSYHL